MVIQKLEQIWKAKDLRNNILFVLGMLVIFRLVAHIPIPGIDVTALQKLFNSSQLLGLMNLFSGGGMENFSIVMMGVAPYITSSIIFQLLTMIVPSLEEMNKEEQGRQKINMWTRWLTVPLAALQAYSMIVLLTRSSSGIVAQMSPFNLLMAIVTITTGTVFLMWLGELITEKKVGNGISLLIFAGIASKLLKTVQQLAVTYDSSQLFTVIGFIVIAIITVIGVVIISEGQRNVPVQYSKQFRGNRMTGGSTSQLPIRVNMAGVIPIIFAVSVVMFPPMVAQFFVQAKSAGVAQAAQYIITLFQNQIFYAISYFVLVLAFTFFYAEIIFHPEQIAENLQKQGGFIPGIRPGKHTADYLAATARRVVLAGAVFLAVIAVMPLAIQYLSGIQTLAIGGTSLLIVVSVVIETMKQVEAQLTMRQYDGV